MDGSSKQAQTTTSTQYRTAAPKSQNELNAENMSAADLQAYEQAQNAYTASPNYLLSQQIAQAAQQNMLNRLNGTSPVVSPQEQAYLDQAFGAPTAQAEAALQRQMSNAAQARGMTLADSPVGGDYALQLQQLEAQIASQRANAALNLGQTNFGNNANAAQFGQNLQQQVMQNRLAGQSSAANFANNLAQQRIALAPVTTTGTMTGTTTQPWSQTLGQFGQGLSGLSTGLFGATDKAGNQWGGLIPSIGALGDKALTNLKGLGGSSSAASNPFGDPLNIGTLQGQTYYGPTDN